jgi:hypothetical protein
LKKLGAPLRLWEDARNCSNKYKLADCTQRWSSFHTQFLSIGSLLALAKEGNLEMLERIRPMLNMINDAFANDGLWQ